MKNIFECKFKLEKKDIDRIVKYGNSTFNFVNFGPTILAILLFAAHFYFGDKEYLSSIVIFILWFNISAKLTGINKCIKKYNYAIKDENCTITINGNQDGINIKNSLTKDSDKFIEYKMVRYIMESKDYILLNIDNFDTKAIIVGIKKNELNIPVEELKLCLMKKCKKLSKFKVTSAPVIYNLLLFDRIFFLIEIAFLILLG